MNIESTFVAIFVKKIYQILAESGEDNEIIRWSKDGDSFIILKPRKFCKIISPKYFKFNNIASFVRQLNIYGFNKINNLKYNQFDDKKMLEFKHESFKRNRPDLLHHIIRKKNKKSNLRPPSPGEDDSSPPHSPTIHLTPFTSSTNSIELKTQNLSPIKLSSPASVTVSYHRHHHHETSSSPSPSPSSSPSLSLPPLQSVISPLQNATSPTRLPSIPTLLLEGRSPCSSFNSFHLPPIATSLMSDEINLSHSPSSSPSCKSESSSPSPMLSPSPSPPLHSPLPSLSSPVISPLLPTHYVPIINDRISCKSSEDTHSNHNNIDNNNNNEIDMLYAKMNDLQRKLELSQEVIQFLELELSYCRQFSERHSS
jgi:hypothetical protein